MWVGVFLTPKPINPALAPFSRSGIYLLRMECVQYAVAHRGWSVSLPRCARLMTIWDGRNAIIDYWQGSLVSSANRNHHNQHQHHMRTVVIMLISALRRGVWRNGTSIPKVSWQRKESPTTWQRWSARAEQIELSIVLSSEKSISTCLQCCGARKAACLV